MNDKYEGLRALLERFDWLHDSLVHSILFESTLRYEVKVTLFTRVVDPHRGYSANTVKLVLSGVNEFRLAQAGNWMSFETSSGAAIARDGERLFLTLGSSAKPADADDLANLTIFSRPPREQSLEEIRQSDFYLDFADFTVEVLPERKP